MDKQHLFQALEERAGDYRRHRPATAEMDINIFRVYCAGKTAVQVSIETPCSESTVYRAIHRVQEFLQTPNMASFMATLQRHLDQYEPCYGDADIRSPLELLYTAYCECNHFNGTDTKEGFAKLYTALSGLPLDTVDKVIDEVCALCHCHERDSFTEGLKLGVKLGEELSA